MLDSDNDLQVQHDSMDKYAFNDMQIVFIYHYKIRVWTLWVIFMFNPERLNCSNYCPGLIVWLTQFDHVITCMEQSPCGSQGFSSWN